MYQATSMIVLIVTIIMNQMRVLIKDNDLDGRTIRSIKYAASSVDIYMTRKVCEIATETIDRTSELWINRIKKKVMAKIYRLVDDALEDLSVLTLLDIGICVVVLLMGSVLIITITV